MSSTVNIYSLKYKMNLVIFKEKHLTGTFSQLSENGYFHFSHLKRRLLIIMTYIKTSACIGVIAGQYFALSKDVNTCSLLEEQEDLFYLWWGWQEC